MNSAKPKCLPLNSIMVSSSFIIFKLLPVYKLTNPRTIEATYIQLSIQLYYSATPPASIQNLISVRQYL